MILISKGFHAKKLWAAFSTLPVNLYILDLLNKLKKQIND